MTVNQDANRLRRTVLARIGYPEDRSYRYRCAVLADLAAAPLSTISDWLTGSALEPALAAPIAVWVEDGMPLPDPPVERTASRLSEAPLDALTSAVAEVIGSGSRATLLMAAAAGGARDAEAPARAAIASLPQVHQERILALLNLVLLRDRRAVV